MDMIGLRMMIHEHGVGVEMQICGIEKKSSI